MATHYEGPEESMRQQKVARRLSEATLGCAVCGNLVSCTCGIERTHAGDCRYARAARLSVEIACKHGFQACPICDPCTCGVGATQGVR